MAVDLRGKALSEWLPSRAAASPDATALVAGERRVSWAALDDSVRRLAGGLDGLGLTRGDRLATLLPNSPEFVTAFLAATALGTPVLPLSPQYKEVELEQYLGDARPRLILADPSLLALVGRIVAGLGLDTRIVSAAKGGQASHSLLGLIDAGDPSFAPGPVDPEADALDLYSSGSMGRSKRIPRSQSALCAEAECFRDTVGVSDEDVILCVVPLSHAHGLGNGLLASLRSGAALVLMESFDRRRVMRTLEAEGVTIFPGVPFMFKILAETSLPNAPDLSALRLCFSAGAPLTRQTFTAFRDRFGVPVRQLYGSSETGAVSINLDDDIERLWGSVGPPLVGMDIQIFDDAGQPLGPDQEGAVGIESPSMFRGYATPGGLLRDAIRGGYFFPGDRGRRDTQGRITLTGRETLFINVGGNKVDPAEVESVLASHPAVREAVVLGTRGASGDEAVKAVVVLEQRAEEAELIAHCRERMAGFKVPRVVELRDELPRNPLGKLLRKYLE